MPSATRTELEATEAATGKKVRNSDVYDVTELRGISSFDDAKRLASSRFEDLDNASDVMGSGFAVLNGADKTRLIGVPFIILSMDFNEGDQGPFVSFLVVTKDNAKYVVNDGSSGIYAQLDEWYLRTSKAGGIVVEGGLRKSDYVHEVYGPSTTFYLNV